MPMLKTRYISSSATSPILWMTLKIGKISQECFLISTARPAGRIRGMFSISPPPVMCAIPLISFWFKARLTALTYDLCGTASSLAKGKCNSSNWLPASYGPPLKNIFLIKEAPLVCMPEEPKPSSISPSWILSPVIIFDFSTTPKIQPATSCSPGA